MRLALKMMVALGLVDLLIVLGAAYFHAIAFASQYTGFAAWLLSLSPDIEPTSVEHENLLARIVDMLSRTNGVFLVSVGALAISGVMLNVTGAIGLKFLNSLDRASAT